MNLLHLKEGNQLDVGNLFQLIEINLMQEIFSNSTREYTQSRKLPILCEPFLASKESILTFSAKKTYEHSFCPMQNHTSYEKVNSCINHKKTANILGNALSSTYFVFNTVFCTVGFLRKEGNIIIFGALFCFCNGYLFPGRQGQKVYSVCSFKTWVPVQQGNNKVPVFSKPSSQ